MRDERVLDVIDRFSRDKGAHECQKRVGKIEVGQWMSTWWANPEEQEPCRNRVSSPPGGSQG
jgi:hypothetical protein